MGLRRRASAKAISGSEHEKKKEIKTLTENKPRKTDPSNIESDGTQKKNTKRTFASIRFVKHEVAT
jgi:hypothetical protein